MATHDTDFIYLAAVQCELNATREQNFSRLSELTREAAARGAQIVILPELIDGPYFPQQQREDYFALAHPVEAHPTLAHMSALAQELELVIPVSFFEYDAPHYYNSVAIIDADGRNLGVYRKSHIPDGPGYQEKFYFRPGNTGFCVWHTRYACIGVGICWDQWFPECARAMALMGAELLAYPTAIGSEPQDPELDSCDPWQRVMQGHAVANAMPVVAANRVGSEENITFYGSSFIADMRGDIIDSLDRSETGIANARFSRRALKQYRAAWGFFRDRRPELYEGSGAMQDSQCATPVSLK